MKGTSPKPLTLVDPDDPRPRFSVTERSTFKFCRRQDLFSRIDKLVPQREAIGTLWYGRMIHAGLEYFYKGLPWEEHMQTWWENSIHEDEPEETILEKRDLLETGVELITRYIDFAEEHDSQEWEILEIESEWLVPSPNGLGVLEGHTDMVVLWRDKIWVIDHKTKTSFSDPFELMFDDQMTAYLWMASQLYPDYEIGGAIYNQLRKKKPATPMLLKSGKALSKAKDIDTTVDIYYDAIIENGFDPNDYADVLGSIATKKFFLREPVVRNPHEIASFGEMLDGEMVDMTNPDLPRYSNKQSDCTWRCSYKSLCLATDDGGDVESLIEYSYRVQLQRRI